MTEFAPEGIAKAPARDLRLPGFLAVLAAGFAYVSLARCGRGDPFVSGNGSYFEILAILALAPAVYALGPRANFPRASRADALPAAAWLTGFGLGLHLDVLGGLLGAHFSLTGPSLAHLSGRELVVLAAAAAGLVGFLAWHAVLARRAGILRPWLGALAAGPALLATVTLALAGSHRLHLHHFLWGAWLAPFCRFRTLLSVLAQGFFAGMSVEGSARWGMDSTWYPLAD